MIHFGKQCTLKNSHQRICNLSLLHLPVCVCVCVCVWVCVCVCVCGVCVCVCVCAFDMLSLTMKAGAVPRLLINLHINQMCVIACVCVHEYTERLNDLPYPLWLAAK